MTMMSMDVNGIQRKFHGITNQCTICHHYIEPILVTRPVMNKHPRSCSLVFQCPSCEDLFISEYEAKTNTRDGFDDYIYKASYPKVHQDKKFNSSISNLSSRFSTIYNQSLKAESDCLLEICGPGYRKSLEILVKDYLIKLTPDDEEMIKERPLGQCIQQISDPRIQACAKRAVWLGNDETHYIRKWENKDLQDLKKLIDLVVYYIEMEIIAEEYESDMV
ncbi:hypothetical protein M5X06_03140 [Paenibacillus alvei]|uniref:DUF4145 domain-containing protein n=1 Tax=Paenibacillus alvei TaxID=44250 RepID=A0ABT4H097_PAEAL|nr:hypothetical protein [Paenibacillus alvei]MCY9762066.1 hypothetical protein [Paenibacillus alvei]MCY9765835.1 hypothetical protein [Paenibacillus alvei]